jgi:hypothetical protein
LARFPRKRIRKVLPLLALQCTLELVQLQPRQLERSLVLVLRLLARFPRKRRRWRKL